MVTGVLVGVAARPVIVKLAVVWPAGTITCAGTFTRSALSLTRETSRPPEPGGLSGAGESRPTLKPPRCIPTATVPPVSELMAGCVTVTVLDETVVRPGASRLTTYCPVPVGALMVTVCTWLVPKFPAGIVTWAGVIETMLDGAFVGSVAVNVSVSGLLSASPQNEHAGLRTKPRMVWDGL